MVRGGFPGVSDVRDEGVRRRRFLRFLCPQDGGYGFVGEVVKGSCWVRAVAMVLRHVPQMRAK